MAVTVKTPTIKAAPLDVARIRADFPILQRPVHGKRLVYLDSASSSQKRAANAVRSPASAVSCHSGAL